MNQPKTICQPPTVPQCTWRARWHPTDSQNASAGWQKKKQQKVLKTECQSDSRAAQTFPLCSSPAQSTSKGPFKTARDRNHMARWMI